MHMYKDNHIAISHAASLKPFQQIQNVAAWIIPKKSKLEHITTLFQLFKLSFRFCIDYKLLPMAFKTLKGLGT